MYFSAYGKPLSLETKKNAGRHRAAAGELARADAAPFAGELARAAVISTLAFLRLHHL
jgi:hypothetical protein